MASIGVLSTPTVKETLDVPDGRAVARRSNLRFITLRLAPSSRTLRIDTDDDRVERYIRTMYEKLIGGERAAPTDVAELLTNDAAPTVSFNGIPLPREWTGRGKNPWLSGAYIVDQFVWRSLAQDAEWIAVYACALTVDGRAILVAGGSGVGKTTLALALQRQGAVLHGDEMILVHRATQAVESLDRRLSIRRAEDAGFGTGPAAELLHAHATRIGGRDDGFLALDRDAFGDVFAPAKLAATFLVARDGSGLRIENATATQTAIALGAYLGNRPKKIDDVARLSDVLATGRCFAVNLDDSDGAALAILAAVRRC